jgi:1-acyl-sn-glycerol-3-phosphate acyltransferase
MQAEREDSLEQELARLCAEVGPEDLPVPSRDTALAELGFDSLSCADLAAAVEERFDVRLSGGDVGAFRTIGDITEMVRRKVAAGPRIPPGLGRSQAGLKRTVGWAMRLYTRLRVEGQEHVPPEGPVIISPNHRSMLDVPALVVACPRPVVFMAKQELFGDAFRRRLWLELGGFPVRRDVADIRATDVALALLQEGQAVGLYPEGKRAKGEMLPFLHGPAWLALRTGAALVPCGVIGTGTQPGWHGEARSYRDKHVRVRFGQAIRVERELDPRARKRAAAELTDQLLKRVIDLMA